MKSYAPSCLCIYLLNAVFSRNVSPMFGKDQLYSYFFSSYSSLIFCCRTKRDISMMEMHVVLLLKNFIDNTKYTSSKGIDIILSSILRENIEDYPAMYHVAVKVIRNCSRALDFPIKMVCRVPSVIGYCNVVLQHLRVRLFPR